MSKVIIDKIKMAEYDSDESMKIKVSVVSIQNPITIKGIITAKEIITLQANKEIADELKYTLCKEISDEITNDWFRNYVLRRLFK